MQTRSNDNEDSHRWRRKVLDFGIKRLSTWLRYKTGTEIQEFLANAMPSWQLQRMIQIAQQFLERFGNVATFWIWDKLFQLVVSLVPPSAAPHMEIEMVKQWLNKVLISHPICVFSIWTLFVLVDIVNGIPICWYGRKNAKPLKTAFFEELLTECEELLTECHCCDFWWHQQWEH